MGLAEMIVAIVLIGCGSSVLKEFAKKRSRKGDDALLKEMAGLRDEVRSLRQKNNELILTLDTTLDRVERRLANIESRTALGAPSTAQLAAGAAPR